MERAFFKKKKTSGREMLLIESGVCVCVVNERKNRLFHHEKRLCCNEGISQETSTIHDAKKPVLVT